MAMVMALACGIHVKSVMGMAMARYFATRNDGLPCRTTALNQLPNMPSVGEAITNGNGEGPHVKQHQDQPLMGFMASFGSLQRIVFTVDWEFMFSITEEEEVDDDG
ncbi:hypothetical protein L1987_14780 [Smallanthus sonchifolius]|uniref:Uncharacterized protein n=1 Tax=Smallanthus sonchifolius TaxID=185202 RepID=A0ACB9J3N0_9ASTR|nr:hypothetical protein L1987_14780 [Smallanthus sonchifolius]